LSPNPSYAIQILLQVLVMVTLMELSGESALFNTVTGMLPSASIWSLVMVKQPSEMVLTF